MKLLPRVDLSSLTGGCLIGKHANLIGHRQLSLILNIHLVSGPFALSSTLALDWRRISLFPPPVSSPLIRGLPSTLSVLHQPLYSVSHELFSSILSVSMPHECCTIGCLLQSSELLCAFLTLTQ